MTASLSATDATEMKLSVDGFFDDEAWMPYASTHELFLSESEGLHQAMVIFRDAAGNNSLVVVDDIQKDTTPPTVKAFELGSVQPDENGVLWVTEEAATLTFEVMADDGASGVAGIALVESDLPMLNVETVTFDMVTASPGLYLDTRTLGLSAGEGLKSIFLFLQDVAGNQTMLPVGRFDINVDATPPSFAENGVEVVNAAEGLQLFGEVAELKD